MSTVRAIIKKLPLTGTVTNLPGQEVYFTLMHSEEHNKERQKMPNFGTLTGNLFLWSYQMKIEFEQTLKVSLDLPPGQ